MITFRNIFFTFGASVRTAQERWVMTWFFLLNSDFLMWSILFIQIPSYFSHLWNYGVKFKSKETILLVVQEKKYSVLPAVRKHTKTEIQMPSRPGYLAKKYYLKKMTMQPLSAAFRPSEWMEELYLKSNAFMMVNMHHRTRKRLNQNVCWYHGDVGVPQWPSVVELRCCSCRVTFSR